MGKRSALAIFAVKLNWDEGWNVCQNCTSNKKDSYAWIMEDCGESNWMVSIKLMVCDDQVNDDEIGPNSYVTLSTLSDALKKFVLGCGNH